MLAASTWRAWNNRGQRKENMMSYVDSLSITLDDSRKPDSHCAMVDIGEFTLFLHGLPASMLMFRAAVERATAEYLEADEREESAHEMAEQNETGEMRCPPRE
jgi:hypothetical protein